VAGALRFSYKAGATPGNTILMDANDSAKPIDLKGANFDELLAKSNLYVGPPVPDRARALRNLVVRPTGTLSSSSLAGRASRVTPGLEPSQNDRTSRPPRAGGDHATRRTR